VSSSPVATTAKPSPATTPTGRFRARFVHVEGAAIQFGSIQLSDGRLRVLRVGHFYEGKAAGLTGVPVRDDIDSFNVAELGKSREQVLLRGLEAEITDKNVAHGVLVRMFKLSR
jgi:hypothetical protein